MNTEELGALYDKLEELRAAGKEEEAKELLRSKLRDLPEDVQDSLMLSMFADALAQEADGLQAVRDLQEQGLKAAEALKKQEEANKNAA